MLVAALAVGTLAGCTPQAGEAAGPVSSSPAPGASAPANSAAPPSSAATGCPPSGSGTPAGADTATLPDLDGDGLPDTEWYSDAGAPFSYGITTASGATVSLPDGMAGPTQHSGWTARLGSGVVVTVISDGRGAQLAAFVDCEFVTPIGADGRPYTFDMENLRENGTGIGCLPGGDGPTLAGVQALPADDDTFTVTATEVDVSADGLTAENGATSTLAEGAPAGDPVVQAAQRSSCDDVPVVATSGQ
jgi:hypothetical protein